MIPSIKLPELNIENGWADEDPRLILAVIVGILVAVIYGIFTHRKIIRRKKQKQQAIELGHIIKAKRVKIYKQSDTTESGAIETHYSGVYEYTVNGKTKRYRVHSDSGLPLIELNLYYADTPAKVFSDYEHYQLGYNIGILLGIAAGMLTMYVTGYFSSPI